MFTRLLGKPEKVRLSNSDFKGAPGAYNAEYGNLKFVEITVSIYTACLLFTTSNVVSLLPSDESVTENGV